MVFGYALNGVCGLDLGGLEIQGAEFGVQDARQRGNVICGLRVLKDAYEGVVMSLKFSHHEKIVDVLWSWKNTMVVDLALF